MADTSGVLFWDTAIFLWTEKETFYEYGHAMER